AYCSPNNGALIVVGDCNGAELRRLVNRDFAGVPGHAGPESLRCNASPKGKNPLRRELRDQNANLDLVMHLYRIPEHRSPDTPALEVLNLIVGEGESSRLNVAVVRREKAAVATGALMNPFGSRNGPGVLFAYGVVNQGVTAEHMDSSIGMQLD